MLTEKEHAQRTSAAAASLATRRAKKAQRQAEVKRLHAEGQSKAEIARLLDVSYNTILTDFRDFRSETEEQDTVAIEHIQIVWGDGKQAAHFYADEASLNAYRDARPIADIPEAIRAELWKLIKGGN